MTGHDRRRSGLAHAGVVAAVIGVVWVVGLGVGPVVADARPYVPSGRAVTGGADAGAAVPLAPGVYVDTLPEGAATPADTGSVRYFSIAVRSGQRPYVAVTLANPDTGAADGQLGLQLALTAQGETNSCATESSADYTTDDHLDPVTAVLAPGPIGSDQSCPAGNLVVRVERTGDAVLTDALDVEIAYRLEPAVTTTSGLPGQVVADQPELRTTLTGTPATLASGNSFDTAPLVGTGIYKDTLTPGDTRIVRVHLEWGQRFAYSFSSAPQAGVGTDDAVSATSVIRNPLRQIAAQASGARASAYAVGNAEATLSGATFAPVRYQNRLSDNSDVTDYANAGDYYLVIAAGVPRVADDTLTFPYSLQITVAGKAEAGPVYAGAATTPPAADTGSNLAVRLALVVIIVAVVGVPIVVVSRRRRRRAGRTRQVRSHT